MHEHEYVHTFISAYSQYGQRLKLSHLPMAVVSGYKFCIVVGGHLTSKQVRSVGDETWGEEGRAWGGPGACSRSLQRTRDLPPCTASLEHCTPQPATERAYRFSLNIRRQLLNSYWLHFIHSHCTTTWLISNVVRNIMSSIHFL